MNAPVYSPLPVLAPDAFGRAKAEVHAWRGRCLDAFARTELDITECLVALAAVPGRGGAVERPHLVGERLAALAAALGPEGPLAKEGARAVAAIAAVAALSPVRAMLCHGVATVLLDERGRWTAVLRLTALRGGEPARELLAVDEEEATALLRRITSSGSRLRSRLGQVRAALPTR